MDAPQEGKSSSEVDSGVSELVRSSRKSLLVWSLVILTIALLIGAAVYKRKYIEERFFAKERVAPRKGSVYQVKRSTLSSAAPADSATVVIRTMKKMARKNHSVKTKGAARTPPHLFAYLPTQGKFVEI